MGNDRSIIPDCSPVERRYYLCVYQDCSVAAQPETTLSFTALKYFVLCGRDMWAPTFPVKLDKIDNLLFFYICSMVLAAFYDGWKITTLPTAHLQYRFKH